MMIKVADMLLVVVSAFTSIHLAPVQINEPPVYYDLSQYPSTAQVMNVHARVIHLPSYYLMTCEQACFTGFFEYTGSAFSPYKQYINTRFHRYQQHINLSFFLFGDRQWTRKGGVLTGGSQKRHEKERQHGK